MYKMAFAAFSWGTYSPVSMVWFLLTCTEKWIKQSIHHHRIVAKTDLLWSYKEVKIKRNEILTKQMESCIKIYMGLKILQCTGRTGWAWGNVRSKTGQCLQRQHEKDWNSHKGSSVCSKKIRGKNILKCSEDRLSWKPWSSQHFG